VLENFSSTTFSTTATMSSSNNQVKVTSCPSAGCSSLVGMNFSGQVGINNGTTVTAASGATLTISSTPGYTYNYPVNVQFTNRVNDMGAPLWSPYGYALLNTANNALGVGGVTTDRTVYTISSLQWQPSNAYPPGYTSGNTCDNSAGNYCAIVTFSSAPDWNWNGVTLSSFNFCGSSSTNPGCTSPLTLSGASCNGSNLATWTQYQNATGNASPMFSGLYQLNPNQWWFTFRNIDTTDCNFVSGQIYNTCISAAGSSSPGQPCAPYWQFMPGSYVWPNGFAMAYLASGSDNSSINRLGFQTMTNTTIPTDGTTNGGMQNGMYVQSQANQSFSGGAGLHPYNNCSLAFYANQWQYAEVTRKFEHTNQGNNLISYPEDYPYWRNYGGHFFDTLTRFYFQPSTNALGGSLATIARWSGVTAQQQNFNFWTVNGEADGFINSMCYQYSGNQPSIPTTGRYEVGFNAAINQGGFVEFRTSTSDMHVKGWSSGSCNGTVANGICSDQVQNGGIGNVWYSANISQAPTEYIGMKPHYQVGWIDSSSGNMLVSTGDPWNSAAFNAGNYPNGGASDTFMATGDTVTISGVQGCTAANGNWTVNAIPRQSFYAASTGPATLTDLSIIDGNNTAEATVASTAGLMVGQLVQMMDGVSPLNQSVATPILSIIDGTHLRFTYQQSNWQTIRLAQGSYASGLGTGILYAFSALQLNNSGTCNSAFTRSTSSDLHSTTSTTNFTELTVPQGTTPSPCAVSLSAEINAVLAGGTSCPAYLVGGNTCTVVDVQRIINSELGQACRTGP
jgi:hypothetical protein